MSNDFSDRYADEDFSDVVAAGNGGLHSSTEDPRSGNGSSSEEKAAAQKLAEKKGTKGILLSKVFLIATIVLSAIGVALLTYFYTSSLETNKFKTQVRLFVRLLLRFCKHDIRAKILPYSIFSLIDFSLWI